MASEIDKEQAERIVKNLTMRFGYLRPDLMDRLDQWDQDARREIETNFLAMETALSQSIKTLAKEIYGTGARFIFELLQNADDNQFLKAKKLSSQPFVRFKVYPSHLVVECNEDGFTEEDLTAICNVGQSTKTSEYGYIGAKGIGFKSVFIAAWEVYIQSGFFSFKFTHRKTDSGIGMVRPLWVETSEKIPGPLTRMTLQLHNKGDDVDGISIANELSSLPDSCLLFLRKLQMIQVEHYDSANELVESIDYCKEKVDEFRFRLKKISTARGEQTSQSQLYHITTQQASGLHSSVGRSRSESDSSTNIGSTAEVVLAFPLTSQYEPNLLDPQQLFAFLPVRHHAYKFIIHSDFDMMANRQDILTTSKRNLGLRKWIATAFVTAALEFCEHDELRYTWPLFLPTTDQSNWDSFWAGFNSELRAQLAQTPILEPRAALQLRLIKDVRILSSSYQLNGRPIFWSDIFLSTVYGAQARNRLEQYGLQRPSLEENLDIIERGVRRTICGMRPEKLEQWHSAAAQLLCSLFDTSSLASARLHSMRLLPLRNGNWKKSNHSATYLPATGGFTIPECLNIDVIDPAATSNSDRLALFERLGVTQARTDVIRDLILTNLQNRKFLQLKDFFSCLHFLFLTHPKGATVRSLALPIATELRQWKLPAEDVYLNSSIDPFAAYKLLKGMEAHFTHPDYMVDAPKPPNSEHPTWIRWVYDALDIRERIRMISRTEENLSEAFFFVLEHHPDSFLGLFAHLWPHEANRVAGSPRLRGIISSLPARKLCRHGNPDALDLKQRQHVYRLYVAIATKQIGQRNKDATADRLKKFFSAGGILVPSDNTTTWATSSACVWQGPPSLLTKHSLRSAYSRIIGEDEILCIEQLFSKTVGIQPVSMDDLVAELVKHRTLANCDLGAITGIYDYLHCNSFSNANLKNAFKMSPLIMVPIQGLPSWYKTGDTLWSSSAAIRGKVTLDAHYYKLKAFFVSKLGVKSLTLEMVYDELKHEPQTGTQEDIRVAMLALSNFLKEERTLLDPAPLRDASIFPVVYGDNEPILRSAKSDFAIADRAHLTEKFRGRIALLSFDMEDIRQLGPFFSWIDLEGRFLSNSVREITTVLPESGRPLQNPDRDLCRKAYYILRVAATFCSPRYQEDPIQLYTLLRNAQTIETNEIQVTLQLSQNGKSIPMEDTSANAHIDDLGSSTLKIFVPKGAKAQAICYCSILPRRLLQWLMDYPAGRIEDHADSTAINALISILASDRGALDDILDRQGIVPVDIEDEDRSESEQSEETGDRETSAGPQSYVTALEDHSDTETLVETTDVQSHMARENRSASLMPQLRALPPARHEASAETQVFVPDSLQDWPRRDDLYATALESSRGEDVRYRALLERVVSSAEAAAFPSRGSSNMDTLQDALLSEEGDRTVYGFDGSEIAHGFRTSSQLERDKKVGAAGELYVFVLLSSLRLPGWSMDNWQSTIRTYAQAHPRYANIQPWNLRETADFVYDDQRGDFTSVLIDSGYLTADDWREARPKFFIEVKSTTSSCSTPFYMSNNQFNLMRRKHRNQDKSEVYLILRVFGLNGRLGMCAYLDPEELRLNGQLHFTAQSWSIIPSS
ncbi:hypothetical protein PWT90_07563 [Aphanocladium album]|nr:hypothetical protein PWT90_07563 [Aphanocladium album]